MSETAAWEGQILIRREDPAAAERLFLALTPEAAREVPRARAVIDRPEERTVRVRLTARDTGSVRAAVNTYLGWISLAERTERAVAAGLRPSPTVP
jgi:tRNA threonylcarbamoyladenosine modification (KEOPS) complex  Pcc1 subunit